jgi:hypothetical protein
LLFFTCHSSNDGTGKTRAYKTGADLNSGFRKELVKEQTFSQPIIADEKKKKVLL